MPLIDCECWPHILVSAMKHWHNHRVWERGKPITRAPYSAGIALDGFSVVSCAGPPAAVDFCYLLAQTFRRQGGYDFAAWSAWASVDDDDELAYHARMFLWAQQGAVRAWAVVRDRERAYWTGDVSEDGRIPGQAHDCVSIDTIFVVKNARRHGLARRLVAEIARVSTAPISALGWGAPLSDDGKALAQSLMGTHFWLT